MEETGDEDADVPAIAEGPAVDDLLSYQSGTCFMAPRPTDVLKRRSYRRSLLLWLLDIFRFPYQKKW
jgi:hypothetical protein